MTDLLGITLSGAAIAVSAALITLAVAITRRQPAAPQPAAPATPPAAQIHPATSRPAAEPVSTATKLPWILVDTSAIIDGRIADIATAGFVPGRLVVPRFVLAELQNIADSEDAMRRGRGRRGLDVLAKIRDLPGVGIEVIDDDVTGVKEVDAKLVVLAQRFKCNVLTTDYNLNQVAGIQGVRVLNVNELSNAIRPVVLPGETMRVRVVQPGKERNQGVGYLADGTMIVVENGDKMIGQEVTTEVTRVFQTVAGKMIFAAPVGQPNAVPTADPTTAGKPMSPQVKPASPEDALLEAIEASDTKPAAPHHRHRNRGRGHRGPKAAA